MSQVPITKAIFDADDLATILEPLKSGWVVQGPYVAAFERDFSGWTQAGHAMATTSCTTALQLAMAALRLGPGDEVLVPAFTWIATANVVEHCGAKAVFVDVDLHTFNIDPDLLEAAITPRTVGIIPVHLFGQPAPMGRIMAIARAHGLWVVEDAACGFDTWLDGRHVGTFGDFGCFSFHPRKSITTGEGGMVTTDRADHAALIRTLRDHGASRSDLERHEQRHAFLLAEYRHLGFNYRMTDLQGALGTSQLRKAAWIMAGRRQAAAWYDAMLAGVEWLRTPRRDPRVRHGEQSYVCLFQPEAPTLGNVDRLFARRNDGMSALESQGIVTRQGTHAPPHLHYYAAAYGYQPADFPAAYLAERCSITLPMYAGMTEGDCARVVEALHAVFAGVPA
ncbi:MAG: DegT/DnrJ/EryC1/StrS family aminotransferase [Gemmatimonadaceae bacterium]|nr:DegT/DnrJ/EryC1/StrS family aminotransferase [Gemmatimonadaceae bacterium]